MLHLLPIFAGRPVLAEGEVPPSCLASWLKVSFEGPAFEAAFAASWLPVTLAEPFPWFSLS